MSTYATVVMKPAKSINDTISTKKQNTFMKPKFTKRTTTMNEPRKSYVPAQPSKKAPSRFQVSKGKSYTSQTREKVSYRPRAKEYQAPRNCIKKILSKGKLHDPVEVMRAKSPNVNYRTNPENEEAFMNVPSELDKTAVPAPTTQYLFTDTTRLDTSSS